VPYRVDLSVATDAAIERLIELGALDVDVSQEGLASALMPDSVTPEDLTRAVGVADISPAVGRDDDSVWILRQRPIQVGRIRIAPADMAPAPGTIRLIDAPAFGTGLHPTTALCLGVLDDFVTEASAIDAMLDVGTGSGVLALAALALGVPQVTGVDTDAAALRAAAENARLNGWERRVSLSLGGPETLAGRWPLVAANILAAPLIEMAPSLASRVGHHGRLLLSGIPQSVEADVQQAYRHLGMRRVQAISRAGWVALVLQATW
jgi:ribosomal protein L11 methyltransferase